jgi:hypothetical protein
MFVKLAYLKNKKKRKKGAGIEKKEQLIYKLLYSYYEASRSRAKKGLF